MFNHNSYNSTWEVKISMLHGMVNSQVLWYQPVEAYLLMMKQH